ncbi:MAG: hypothetical protein QM756_02950 [Polyangiaceae bacterium]
MRACCLLRRGCLAWVALALACGQVSGTNDTEAKGSGGTTGGATNDGSCDADADHDGLPDSIEGKFDAQPDLSRDTDLDMTPDYLDLDSDNDGFTDAQERGDVPCSARNSDSDGLYDFQDLDSDNDGLLDIDEGLIGTDPTRVDTDGDGCWDRVELDWGECAPERDIVLVPHCSSDAVGGTLVATIPQTFTDELIELTLVVDSLPPELVGSFSVAAIGVSPPDGAVIEAGTRLSHVRPGAAIKIGVGVQRAWPGLRATVSLQEPSRSRWLAGHVFVAPAVSDCVYPK